MKRVLSWLVLCVLAFASSPAWSGSLTLLGAGKPSAAGGAPMVTPIIMDVAGLNPSNSVVNYASVVNATFASGINTRRSVIPAAGTISALNVRFPTAIGGGTTYDVHLMLNGAASALTCQITSAALTCADNSNSVTVAAGDTIEYRITPTGTPTAQTAGIQIATKFTSTASGEGIILTGGNASPSTSAANYLGPGTGGPWNATQATAASIMPTDGVIDKLNILLEAAPGAAKSYVFTVYKNGSATGLTCTLTGAGSGAGITTCTDASNSVTVAATDTVSFEAVPSGTPSAGTAPKISVRWTPSIPGEAVSMIVTGSGSNGANRYGPFAGTILTATESSSYGISPSSFTVKKLYVSIDMAPGGAATRTNTLRAGTGSGQSNQAVTCQITSAITSCSDVSNSYAASAGTLLNWQTVPASTPATANTYKFSAVLYTP